MILDKIVFDNFAIYAGHTEIPLAPADPARPIVLFGGMNGSGKTTLLDAVQLAFYGKHAQCSNRGDSYEAFLGDAIHRGANRATGASIGLHFRRTLEGTEHRFTVTRSWAESKTGIRERVEVLQNGIKNPALTEDWAEYIEAYLPQKIANLFFFDGEQIKELAEGAPAADMLKTAVSTLLGLDIMDRLAADLSVLERRKRVAGKTDTVRAALKAMEAEADKLQAVYDEATHDCGTALNTLEQAQKALKAAEDKYRSDGGDLYERKAAIENDRQTAQREIHALEENLREIAAGPLPLTLLQDQLNELDRLMSAELDHRDNQVLVALLQQRDGQLLTLLRKCRSPQTTIDAIHRFMETDRKNREKQTPITVILAADAHDIAELRVLRKTSLPELHGTAIEQAEQIAALQERLDTLDQQLAQVPSPDALTEIGRQLAAARAAVREAQGKLDALTAKKEHLARELSARRLAYARELENHEHASIQQDDDERILRHSTRVRETLVRLRSAAISRRIDVLERLILESFTQLIRKPDFISALTIRPEDFRVRLTANDGNVLPIARLSTGERQLLATSMLWGLARASGRTVPTIIDTPLGRLDSSHREHLVQRYFPVASHQVILLSTDEEIDECHLERLKPYVSRSYRLEYDNRRRATTVREGYFWS